MNERDENDKLRADLRADNSDLSDIRNALGSGMRPVLPELQGDAVPVVKMEIRHNRFSPETVYPEVIAHFKTTGSAWKKLAPGYYDLILAAPTASTSADAPSTHKREPRRESEGYFARLVERYGMAMFESRHDEAVRLKIEICSKHGEAKRALLAAPIAPTQVPVGDSDQAALDAIVEYYKSSDTAREILRAWYRTECLAAPIASALPAQGFATCALCPKPRMCITVSDCCFHTADKEPK